MKIAFEGHVPVPHDEMLRHVAHAKGLGLPLVSASEAHGRPLAIVGGGPSILEHLDQIAGYSDIWSINGACGFLRDHGIASTLLSVDPCDFLAQRVTGATRVLLATRCHPDVFDVLSGADVTLFDLSNDVPGGFDVSTATAMAAFSLGPYLGYRKFVFFGCEGSYSDKTHAYMDEAELQDLRFVVECGGERFLTSPDLYMLTLQLARIVAMSAGDAITEQSGGLLRALVKCPEHDIVDISAGLRASLRHVCPSCGQEQGHYDNCEVGMGVV